MGELGNLIEQYRQSVWPEPSNVDIAKRLHVTKSSVGNWIAGTTPKPANLRALARLMSVPYRDVLSAVLADAGYLARGREPGGNTAANTGDDVEARADASSLDEEPESEASPQPGEPGQGEAHS